MLERAATLAVSSAALKGGSAVGAMPSSLACRSAIHAWLGSGLAFGFGFGFGVGLKLGLAY